MLEFRTCVSLLLLVQFPTMLLTIELLLKFGFIKHGSGSARVSSGFGGWDPSLPSKFSVCSAVSVETRVMQRLISISSKLSLSSSMVESNLVVEILFLSNRGFFRFRPQNICQISALNLGWLKA